MASTIKLPDLGTTVEECKVLAWRVAEGDAVKRGQILADIETDKAVTELESTAEGVVLQLAVKAGAVARTGDVLAYVGRLGESIPDATQPVAAPRVAPPVAPAVAEALPKATARAQGPGSSVHASPMVRNLAAKLGVDLSRVRGTGPGGVITREDVQRASQVPTD